MSIKVALQNPFNGEIKFVKVGWSWTLFFFSTFLGIPLFLRKLIAWGFVFVTLNVLGALGTVIGGSGGLAISALVNLIDIVLMIIMAVKGNELTAKALLARGWRFVDPNSEMTKFAKMRWHIFDQPAASPAPPLSQPSQV
jgi:hypothetical protein